MLQRWRGFGDGESGTGDPGARLQSADDLAQLVAANDARNAALTNVDPLTALQSQVSGAVPAGLRLPLVIAGVGLVALLLTPSSGGSRRR
jgi:hypothetical protein